MELIRLTVNVVLLEFVPKNEHEHVRILCGCWVFAVG
jgi:hypothetical protein